MVVHKEPRKTETELKMHLKHKKIPLSKKTLIVIINKSILSKIMECRIFGWLFFFFTYSRFRFFPSHFKTENMHSQGVFFKFLRNESN